MRGMSIGKLAKAAGVSVDTIRFYEKCGVLAEPTRRPSGFREYSSRDLECLRFVRRARGLGFSIPQILEILTLDHEKDPERLTALLAANITLVDQKIAELLRWRALFQRRLLAGDAKSEPRSSIAELFHDEAADTDFEIDRASSFTPENHDES